MSDVDVDDLQNFYDDPSELHETEVPGMGGSPRAMHMKELAEQRKVKRELPRVVADSPEYSSTLALLKRTKEGVREFADQYSALDTILHLPGNMELKRTIAKMFADPQNAEEIRRQEYQRREERYAADKKRLAEKQAEQLRKEQATLQKDLEHLA
eukprot:TRINITY_DN70051_c0_g1_i1.p1 TRINITY_DN70051_c0_g1~~TRINITY_DN70051_c0_g1_i1.p1  ORF type:complete len:182 (+),score=79.76 TRINITY_DN70051_c0_g1_i1:84-548(+)